MTRLVWVGKRTIGSFQGSFATTGQEVTSNIVFVLLGHVGTYLKVIP